MNQHQSRSCKPFSPGCLVVLATFCWALTLLGDSTVVFSELMYQPPDNEPVMEWVEIHNQMAVDMDISGWSIQGGIQYGFPEGTVIAGGGYLVVAISPDTLGRLAGITDVYGPFAGRLSNSGERLELRNNNQRLMDSVRYGIEGDWPVGPGGGGLSLAKIHPHAASATSSSWQSSREIGGTPGRANFQSLTGAAPAKVLAGEDQVWNFDDSGRDLGSGWRESAFDDAGWGKGIGAFHAGDPQSTPSGEELIGTLFSTGLSEDGKPLIPGVRDPHYTLVSSAQSTPPPPEVAALVIENHPAWISNDPASMWIGPVNPGTANVAHGRYNYRTRFDLTGYNPANATVELNIAVDNELEDVLINGTSTGIKFTGFNQFGPTQRIAGGFRPGINTFDFLTLNHGDSPNPAGLRVKAIGKAPRSVPLRTAVEVRGVTHYFRTQFLFEGDPTETVLLLRALADDGAVFYLNGLELLRLNMPEGVVAAGTRALTNVSNAVHINSGPLSTHALVAGTNTLAVEVHQSASDGRDVLFAAELVAEIGVPRQPSISFNEIAAAAAAPFWIELVNHGSDSISLAGNSIVRRGGNGGEYTFPPGSLLVPGGHLTILEDQLGFRPRAEDKLFLYGPGRKRLLDAVVAKTEHRGRHPDGTGRWLSPSEATPGAANVFEFSDGVVINEIFYHPPALAETGTELPVRLPPGSWLELYNRGNRPVDMSGWRFERGVSYTFPSGTTLGAGEYLVLAEDADRLREQWPGIRIVGNFSGRLSNRGDHLVLVDARGNPVNEVHYHDGGRWPRYADGYGASLELRDPRADNSKPEAWAASNEGARSEWKSYNYRSVASGTIGPTRWNEFVLGLLQAGEALLDDISVVEDPGGAARQLIQNGSFESGSDGWRLLGNHSRSRVIPDPSNPGNRVLHLVATGPTEHMHNHLETTLAGNRSIVNGREYEVSYRAKWLGGSSQLNTRLYFNRVARTTLLKVPEPNGTPGRLNSRHEPNIGPTYAELLHRPAVPLPGQPVLVSVRAQDPDGIERCTLWWSVNGGGWSSSLMEPQLEGAFAGNVPGQSAGSVVQFYVEAADGSGMGSMHPASGRTSRALYQVNDGRAISSRLHNLRVVMTPADVSSMLAATNVMSNENTGATVIYNEEQVFYDVGVHLQGSQRGRLSSSRVGFTIQFHQDQLFRGVHETISIDRSGGYSGKGGRQDEIVMKHMVNRAGGLAGMYDDLVWLIPPRNEHAGTGLLLMAKHGDVFLDSQYANGSDGTAFKLELIYYPLTTSDGRVDSPKLPQPDEVIGTDFQDLGNDKEAYRWNFLIENNRRRDEYSQIMQLAKAFSLNGSALDARTRELMDVDQWMRTFAMKSLSGDVDTYAHGYPHNFVVYFRPEDQKALAFLWDMDFAWTGSASASLFGGANVQKVIGLTANRRLYLGHMHDLLNTVFNAGYMSRWTEHYGSLAGQNYSGVLSFIRQRSDFVRSQLPAPAEFRITTNNGQPFLTGSAFVTLAGTGWINVREIRVAGWSDPLVVTWTGMNSWQAQLPLLLGKNELLLNALDFRGQPAGSRAITITSSALAGAIDSDGDGIPDRWEIDHGLDPSYPGDALEDLDLDGASNLDEYLAGTDPGDPSSRLTLEVTGAGAGMVKLGFMAVAGRSYTVQATSALGQPHWRAVAHGLAQESDRWIELSGTALKSETQEYYRVVTPMTP
jgi:hypothetical protein